MRRNNMLLWEKRTFHEGASVIIGVDEAGRGPLAGPVVAAAVVLKSSPLKKFVLPKYKERVDDSKKISPKQRERSFTEISKRSVFGIGLKTHRYIDKGNILRATLAAMEEAVRDLLKKYCELNNKDVKDIRKDICVLVDGNLDLNLPYKTIPIVKGDSKSISIAAASIIAKVTRDRIMDRFAKRYPVYNFTKNKGYGTRFHLDVIREHGPCPIHRKSFAPMKLR